MARPATSRPATARSSTPTRIPAGGACRRPRPKEYSMLRKLAFATALAFAAVVAAPAFAQDAATAAAAPAATQQTPVQIVQTIADQLATAIEGHRDELKRDKEKLIAVIDDVFLPHFDIDYASILVLGRHAREATPSQR